MISKKECCEKANYYARLARKVQTIKYLITAALIGYVFILLFA